MKKIKNNFIFFGAVHQDYVFELKNDLVKYRTNPVKHKESYGGVAHNVARMISNHENVSFFSLMTDKETINYLKKYKIDFLPLNKKIEKRYYGVLVNKYKKFELGIANTDVYEKFNKIINLKFLRLLLIVHKLILFSHLNLKMALQATMSVFLLIQLFQKKLKITKKILKIVSLRVATILRKNLNP